MFQFSKVKKWNSYYLLIMYSIFVLKFQVIQNQNQTVESELFLKI